MGKNLKKIISIVLVLIMITSFCGCENKEKTDVEFQMKVTGDIETEIAVSDLSEYETQSVTKDDVKYQAIKATDVLKNIKAFNEDYDIALSSTDSALTIIKKQDIDDDCYFLINGTSLNFYSKNLPRQTRVKDVRRVTVIANKIQGKQKAFRAIYKENCFEKTFGQMFLMDKKVIHAYEGTPSYNGKTCEVRSIQNVVPIEDLAYKLGVTESLPIIGYLADGSEVSLENDGYILEKGNSCNYLDGKGILKYTDIIGVYFDPPKSITDTTNQVLSRIEKGKVMLIEIDGLGFYTLNKFKPEFLAKQNTEAYRTVMPSISNVALASMMTGKTPFETGVKVRGDRALECDDVYSKLEKMGKESVCVEGNTKLINFSIPQILVADDDNDKQNDREIFEKAMEVMEGKDFVFVHFHGFDDFAHTYSHTSKEAEEKLAEIDGYIEKMVEKFQGTVLINSDHGHHSEDFGGKLGDHGTFIPLDMTIPFIVIEK